MGNNLLKANKKIIFARWGSPNRHFYKMLDDEGNKKHFLEALRLLNMHPEDIDRIRKCDFREAQVFSIGEPPLRIDFLTKVNLVSFEEALSHQKFFTIEDFSVAVIGYDHLILTKINTNRPKDKNDIEQLQQIHNPDRK